MHNLCIDALSSLLSAIWVLWVLTPPPPQIHINKRIGLALAACIATESFLLYTARNFFLPLCSPLKTVFGLLFPIPLHSREKLVPYLEAVGPQGQPLPPAGTWLPAWGVSFKSLKIRCVNNCSLVKERFIVQSWGGEGSSKETPFTCIMISCSGISLCNSCPLPLSDYILRMWYPARRALTASLQAKWTEKKERSFIRLVLSANCSAERPLLALVFVPGKNFHCTVVFLLHFHTRGLSAVIMSGLLLFTIPGGI